jgi:hypothetical protein
MLGVNLFSLFSFQYNNISLSISFILLIKICNNKNFNNFIDWTICIVIITAIYPIIYLLNFYGWDKDVLLILIP